MMLNKADAWDAMADYIRLYHPDAATEERVWGERRMVERVMVSGLNAIRTLDKLNAISAAPEPPLFTDEQLAQLKALVRIAVWIRGEQLAHPNAVLRVHLRDEQAHFTGVVAEVDTHNMVVSRARAEFQAGQQLFIQLQQYCEQHAIPEPEWS